LRKQTTLQIVTLPEGAVSERHPSSARGSRTFTPQWADRSGKSLRHPKSEFFSKLLKGSQECYEILLFLVGEFSVQYQIEIFNCVVERDLFRQRTRCDSALCSFRFLWFGYALEFQGQMSIHQGGAAVYVD